MRGRLGALVDGEWRSGLLSGSLLGIATQILIIALNLPLSILLARALRPYERGQYALLLLVPSFLVLLLDPGLGTAAIVLLGRGRFRSGQLTAALLQGALLVTALGLAAFAIATAVPSLRAALGLASGSGAWLPLVLSAACLPLLLVNLYLPSVLLAHHRLVAFQSGRLLLAGSQLVLAAPLALAGHLDLVGALATFLLAQLAAAALHLVLIARVAPLEPLPGFSRGALQPLREAAAFGVKGWAGRILPFLGLRVDQFLIAALMRPAAVGTYAVAVSLAESLWMISQSISTVLFPRVSGSETAEAVEATARASRHALLLLGAGAIVLALVARPMVRALYGAAYAEGAPALVALLPGIVAIGMASVVSSFLTGRGRPELGVMPAIVNVVANVALNLALIPRLGIVGASIASSVSYVLCSILLVIAFLRLSGVRLAEIAVLRRRDFSALAGALRGALGRHPSGS